MNYGITKATPEQVAQAMELREEGVCWETISLLLGCVHAVTWASYVKRATLLGFAAWGGRYDS